MYVYKMYTAHSTKAFCILLLSPCTWKLTELITPYTEMYDLIEITEVATGNYHDCLDCRAIINS